MKFTENENTELKKSTGELKEAVISITAILNKHGKGILYFGIKNNGTLLGHDIGENTLRKISQAIANHIEPKIYPEITAEKTDDLHYIKVSFSGDDKPYFAYGKVYLRVADEDKLLTPAEIEKLILEKNIYQSQWDSKLTGHSFLQTNPEAVKEFVEQLKNSGRTPVKSEVPADVLKKLGLMRGKKLSYAAWHLFCDEQPVELQLAVFKGNDKTGFLDFKPVVKGNLFTLLENAIEYVQDKINWRVEFGKDMKRHEIPEIPLAAFREAIVNSFAHRNFNDPKSNEIAIFPDRIEIFNPGSFPAGLTPDDFIKGHERSHLRNPKIAEMFYYTKNIDRWGSGLQRIDQECKANEIKYRFDVLSNGFMVTFYRPDISSGKTVGKIRKDFGKISERVRKDFGKNTQLIFRQITENPDISAAEIARKLGKTQRTIENHIKKLKDKNYIRRIGPKLGGYWEIIEDDKTNKTDQ